MEALLLLTPLFAFLVVGLTGKFLGDKLSAIITCIAGSVSFLLSLIATAKALSEPFVIKLYNFLPFVSFGLYFDPLSSIMASVVTFVATLVFIYSIGYMHDLFGQWTFKFYAYLSLFLFAMLLIVLSDNLLGIFFGWEGVGLASYLLIGYFHTQKKASNASFEAFVMNRIGDWLFIFGIISSFYLFGSISLQDIFQKVSQVDKYALGISALLLFGGAVGKSGQLPLHTWLPNAMAGPTPVSALLHAATMVAAGVYMVARLYPIFENTPETLKVVAIIGGLTALFSALAATSHTDIKKIIAFSTMSQLGLMYLALGLGDRVSAMFHLTTHAFFKALLFLSAGSVITAFHHQVHDIYQTGGLRKYIPVTYGSFLIGALALAGIFPFSGFFSKDMIIATAYESGLLWGVLASLVSFLTAYYIFREGFVMFHGEKEYEHKPHESPSIMIVPMVVLGVFATVSGFGEGIYSKILGAHKEIHLNIAVMSLVIAFMGIGLAYIIYSRGIIDHKKAYRLLKPIADTFREQFYTERLYHKVIAKGYLMVSKGLHIFMERQFIDGTVNSAYYSAQFLGSFLTLFQRGKINHYSLFIYIGFVLMLLLIIFWR
ncbi:MAG: NADH-quinone oxidoreductase subunit L [Hydrogenobacter sp.]